VTDYGIEKLARHHSVEDFDCGDDALNRYLIRFVWTNRSANAAITYVALADGVVIGFYSLAVGQVAHAEAPDRVVKGLARHPVPVMILARLAVRHDWQGRGIGAGLLRNAMQRTAQAADIAGIRALLVHAKDESARSFYQHFGLSPSPSDRLHLYILIKEIQRYLT
jgi:GNAT superfamily N-acetyltransferase